MTDSMYHSDVATIKALMEKKSGICESPPPRPAPQLLTPMLIQTPTDPVRLVLVHFMCFAHVRVHNCSGLVVASELISDNRRILFAPYGPKWR